MLVLSSEMAGPCTLDSVQLLCGSDVYNHGIFRNAEVYACHTTVTELDSFYEDNYAGNTPQRAMSIDTLYLRWQNGDWQRFGFDDPFDYNGNDNLILEFRWQGDNDSSVYDLGYYTSGNRAVDARSSTAGSGTPRNYMPRFRIFYSQTGIAQGCVSVPANELRVRATPNPFVAGVTLRTAGELTTPVTVDIYSAAGRLVRAFRPSSLVYWDGHDEMGRRVAAGLYLCRVSTGSRVLTAHLVLGD